MVRAKFRCHCIQKNLSADGTSDWATVKLSPVYGPDGSANAQWSRYTPSGEIYMSITNPAAFNKFEEGGEYFVDFIPADPKPDESASGLPGSIDNPQGSRD